MITAHHSRDNGYSFRCECGRWFPTLTRLNSHQVRECHVVTHIHEINCVAYADKSVIVGSCVCGVTCVQFDEFHPAEVLRGA
jgi:hypothetical protein